MIDSLLQRNLAALAAAQPEAAAMVESAVPPQTVPATGRDGSPTFRIPDSAGRLRWFGQSSMPRISAAETLAGFQSPSGNVVLPGILTGLEPLLVLGKLPAQWGVFVIERDPRTVKLAMRIHDYSSSIRSGRLLFLLSDDLQSAMRGFFEANAGYLMPTTLVTVPQRTPAELAHFQRELEQAAAMVAAIQAQAVEHLLKRLSSRTGRERVGAPKLAVLSWDGRQTAMRQIERVRVALDKLHWAHVFCVPDSPRNGHFVAGLQSIERAEADVVLVVNHAPRAFLDAVSPHRRIAFWYPPGAGPVLQGTGDPRGNAFAFVSTKSTRDRLISAGWDSRRVLSCPVAADATACSMMPDLREGIRRPSKAAILMDLPESSPEALQISLHSHIALWTALHARACAEMERIGDRTADLWLDRAQKESETTLSDARVREHFLGLIRSCLVPLGLAHQAARTAVAAGLHTELWGSNWPRVANAQEPRGSIPTGQALFKAICHVDVVVLPDAAADWLEIALDALALGREVLCGTSLEQFSSEHLGLAAVGSSMHFYQTPADLLALLQQLRYDPPRSVARRQEARALIAREHTVANRLRAMLSTLGWRGLECGPS